MAQFHIKVLLATGVVEHYYPHFEGEISVDQFRTPGGWTFTRTGELDWFPDVMVRGVSISIFKGYMLTVGKSEVYCASTGDADIIEALGAVHDDLAEKLKAIKEYLKCKPSS